MNRALIAAVLVISPVWIGGVSQGAVYTLLAISVVLFAFNFFTNFRKKELIAVDHLSLAFGFLSVVAVLQLIPIPMGILELVSGTTARLVGASGGLTSQEIAFHPVSGDPAATLDRGFRFLTIFLLGVTTLNLRGKKVWETYLTAMLASGLIVLGIGVFANGQSSLFGIETTIGFRGPSPFVNTNHGAAYFGFMTLCAAALAQRLWDRNQIKAGAATAVGGIFFVVVLIHNSLGANLILVLALLWLLKPKKISDLQTAAAVVASASVLLIVWWLGLADVVTSKILGNTSDAVNRFELLKAAAYAFPDYWLTGSGLGSMEVTIARYIDWSVVNPSTVPTLENELAEFFVAIGIFALLVLGAFVWVFYRAAVVQLSAKRRRVRVRFVFIAYFFAMTLVHFPLFTLGLVLPWVIGIAVSTTNNSNLLELSSRKFAIGVAILCGSLLFCIGYRNAPSHLDAGRFISDATKAVKGGDAKRALKLTDHAWALRPLPQVARYRARIIALSDQTRAAEIYRFAVDYLPASEALLVDVVTDLDTSELRVTAFAGKPEIHLRVIELVRRLESDYQAIDLAMTLLSSHPTDATKNAIFELMLSAGHEDVARAWGATQELSDDVIQRFERDLQLADGKGQTMFAQLDPSSNTDARYLLSNRHRFDGADGVRSGVTKALATWCSSPIPAGRRRVCWRNEAWLEEQNGEFESAVRVLRRIQTRSANPIPLAKFLKRHHRCKELIELGSSVPKRHQKALDRITRSCKTIDP